MWEYREVLLSNDVVEMARQIRDLEARGWKWLADVELESVFRRRQGQVEYD